MTRAQLVSKLSLQMHITKKEADIYLSAFLDSIVDTLHKGGRIVIQGFGSFKVNEYKARIAKKPLTGELIQLPLRHKPSFHAGKELRELVNVEMIEEQEEEEFISRAQLPKTHSTFQQSRT
jgi:nucleoid DNA-binding protein